MHSSDARNSSSDLETGVADNPHFVYVIGAQSPDDGGYEAYKIGWSAAPARRLMTLQTGNHRTLEFVHLYRFRHKDAARYFEEGLKDDCREYAIRGEWIGYPDLFELGDFIKNKIKARLRRVEIQVVDLTGFVAMYGLTEELFGGSFKGVLTAELTVDELDHVLRHESGKPLAVEHP